MQDRKLTDSRAQGYRFIEPRRPPSSLGRTAAFVGGVTLGLAVVGSAYANPTGGVVVAGSATITTPKASLLDVTQSTSKAVIDWRTFSIDAGQEVEFIQPSSTSETLNRVLDAQSSKIDGVLDANGRVFIFNSSGVLFGHDARVNVGGLVATTSSIGNADFMAGRLNFTAAARPGAAVDNQGNITVAEGGFAALVAPSVRNSGVIQAKLGRVTLAGGETFTVDLYGDHLINFAVPTKNAATPATYQVDQSGRLIADGGQIVLSTAAAAGIVGGSINMSGVTQARTARQGATGEIILDAGSGNVRISGTLDASGSAADESGGHVAAYGSNVVVASTGTVLASGGAGGGDIQIGGDVAAEQSSPRAATAAVEEGATVDASALEAGHGGQISVWGTQNATIAGTLKATGGAYGGDGGNIEVSTSGELQFLGNADSTAANGKAGTLLLDPSSITIEAIGSSTVTSSVISGNALSTMLRAGQNVELQATTSITDDYLVDGRPLTGSAASGSVSFTAGSIFINSPLITNRNSISLDATGGSITFDKTGFLYVANSSNNAAGAISLRASQSVLVAPTAVGAGVGEPDGGQLLTSGPVTVTATAGDVTFLESLNGVSGTNGLGSLTVDAGGNITLPGARSTGAVVLDGTGAASSITTGGASGGSPITSSGGKISLTAGSGGITVGPATVAGAAAAGLQAQGGDVVLLTPGAVTLQSGILSTQGNVCLGGGAKAACASALSAARVGSVSSIAGADIQAGTASASTGTGGISIYANGAVTLQDLRVTPSGQVQVDTLGGATFDHALEGMQASGSAKPSGIGALSVAAAGNVQLAGAYVVGLLKVDTAGAISTAVPAGGTLASLIGGAGVTLDGGTGVTLSGYPAATTAVLAGYGVDDTTVVNANAPLAINGTRSGAVTIGNALQATGAVSIGSVGAAVASVTDTAAIQAGDPGSASTPAINVYSKGDVSAAQLFTRGAIDVSSSTGNVKFADALNGLNTTPLSSLTVDAGGNITLPGARSTGAVVLDGTGAASSITTGGASGGSPITSSGGKISLTAGSGGITVGPATVAGAAAAGLQAQGGDVVLLTPGAVTLQSGILSTQGNVCLGGGAKAACASALSAARVGSVSSIAGADIQAGTASASTGTGGISIYANGAVTLQDLRVTPSGQVQVDTLGGATFDHALNGIGAASPAGIGALTVNAVGPVVLNGANVTGNGTSATGLITIACSGASCGISDQSATAGGQPSILQATNGIALTSGSGGISIGSQFDSGGTKPDFLLDGLRVTGTGNVVLLTSGNVLLDSSVSVATGDICLGGGAGSPCGGSLIPSGISMAAIPGATTADLPVTTALEVGNALIGAGNADPAIWVRAVDTGPANVYSDVRLKSPTTPLQGEIWLGALVGGPNVDVNIQGRDVTVLGSIAGANQLSASDANQTTPVTTGLEGMKSVTIFGDRSVDLRDVRVGTPGTMTFDDAHPGLTIGTDATAEAAPGYLDPTDVGISIRGELVSYSPVQIGLATPSTNPTVNAQVNLSNNIYTYGQDVTVNGDITLFNGIDLAMVFRQLPNLGTAVLSGPLQTTSGGPDPYFDINLFDTSMSTSGLNSIPTIGNRFQLVNAAGANLYFAQTTNEVAAIFGQLVATIDTRNLNKITDAQSGVAPATPLSTDGQVTVNGAVSRYFPPPVAVPGGSIQGINPFFDASELLAAQAPDPTVNNGNLGVGVNWVNNTFTYNVLDPNNAFAGEPPTHFLSTTYVSPSFVSQTLNVLASGVTINGNVGGGLSNVPQVNNSGTINYEYKFVSGTIDSLTVTWTRTCPTAGPCTLNSNPTFVNGGISGEDFVGTPTQGLFVINAVTFTPGPVVTETTAGTLNFLSQNAGPADAFDSANPYENWTVTVAGSPVSNFGESAQVQGLFFGFDANNPGALAFPPGGVQAPNAGSTVSLNFRGGAGGATTTATSTGSSNSSSDVLASGSTTSVATDQGLGDFPAPVAAVVDESSEILATLTQDSRRQPESTEGETAQETDRCPRGAGRTADLGNVAALSGSASNVFSSCPEAHGK